MARRTVVLVLGVVLAFFASTLGAVAHAQYIPGQPGFTIDPSLVPDTGGQVTITGVGCPPDTRVDAWIVVNGVEVPIGSGQSEDDPDGGFQFEATIPPLPAGEYTVIVRCGPVTMSNILTVYSTAPPITARPLPRTGSEVMGFVKIGLALIALGGLLLLAERKRRQRERA